MKNAKLWVAVGLAGVMAACTGRNIDSVRDIEPEGSAFSRALAEEYRQIAIFEADQMRDWPDADLMASKGLRAARGEVVEPEDLDSWDLPSPEVTELDLARAQLVGHLEASARQKAPEQAARAQARFDCWVEQQEENHQPEHIAACRQAFYAALGKVELAMAPEPAPKTAATVEAPRKYTVLFDFDSDSIRGEGRQILNEALEAATAVEKGTYSVTGHADRAGAESYNMDLSIRRADAVRDYLIKRDVSNGDISIAGRGEAQPAMPTPDGAREQANRRVEVVIQ